MNYHAYELAHAILSPMRLGVEALQRGIDFPFNPFGQTPMGRSMSAACELFENLTRRYGKPHFGISSVKMGGLDVPITEEIVLRKPFGSLLIASVRSPAIATIPRCCWWRPCLATTPRCCAARCRA